MTVGEALLGFALLAGLLTIVPGLDTALVLRSALRRSPRYAAAAGLGIISGALVWGAAAAVGASALLQASELAYRLLAVVGVAYVLWIGVSMLWRSFTGAGEPVDESAPPRGSLLQAWATGFLTNLLNPKVGVFYLATIPLFIPPGESPLLTGLLLAAVHGVLTVVWFAGIIAGAAYAGRWLRSPRAARIIDRVTGAALIVLGGKLLLDSRALAA